MTKFIYLISFLVILSSCNQDTAVKTNEVKTNVIKKAKCYFFFISDCPASINSLPKVQRIHNKYFKSGIEVIGVVSDPNIDKEKLKKTISDFGVTFEIIEDENLNVAQIHNAIVTPQVFLYDKHSTLIYSGLVDNYYIQIGKHRNRATANYLNDAISSYLNDNEIIKPKTDPIGCAINFDY